MEFIQLEDLDTGRKSSLATGIIGTDPASLEVVGILPHHSRVKPASREDAVKLKAYAEACIAEFDKGQ